MTRWPSRCRGSGLLLVLVLPVLPDLTDLTCMYFRPGCGQALELRLAHNRRPAVPARTFCIQGPVTAASRETKEEEGNDGRGGGGAGT